jgi:hypothetical protein
MIKKPCYRAYCGTNPVSLWTDYNFACHMAEKCLATSPASEVTIVRQADKLQVSAALALSLPDLTANQIFHIHGKHETV